MRYRTLRILVFHTVFFAAGPVWSHHSPTAIFNMDKKSTVAGTLTQVDWFNPHIVVYLDAKKADGSAETWKFESNPPSWFRRVGLSRSDIAKAIGQPVTVEAAPAKDGSLYGYLMKITFKDGDSLELVLPAGGFTR